MTTTHRIATGVVLALALALASAVSVIRQGWSISECHWLRGPSRCREQYQTTAKDIMNAASPFVQAASAPGAHQLAARDAVRDTASVSTSPHSEVTDNGAMAPTPPVVRV